jgi:hypothetical protein
MGAVRGAGDGSETSTSDLWQCGQTRATDLTGSAQCGHGRRSPAIAKMIKHPIGPSNSPRKNPEIDEPLRAPIAVAMTIEAIQMRISTGRITEGIQDACIQACTNP